MLLEVQLQGVCYVVCFGVKLPVHKLPMPCLVGALNAGCAGHVWGLRSFLLTALLYGLVTCAVIC
jgi:hypothetical protein